MANPDEHKGIECMNPDCKALEQRKAKGQLQRKHEHIIRKTECKACGTVMEFVESPVRVVELKNNHLNK